MEKSKTERKCRAESEGRKETERETAQRRPGRRARGRNAEEIAYLVKRGGIVPLRPIIRPAFDHLNTEVVHLIRDCWVETPSERPTIEKYANKLEEEVQERTKELEGEKRKSDILLYRMMPRLTGGAL
ncbi:hypothetical protein niasHT_020793 [Heterodera trifolii]|uniref:Serine-threonine/tyrosine-protein kinase catalytic domain-containing protein n=1 Tax=Heterodera trifolii TaxID=157864 RepID=A0ABD2KEZ6_9BILA